MKNKGWQGWSYKVLTSLVWAIVERQEKRKKKATTLKKLGKNLGDFEHQVDLRPQGHKTLRNSCHHPSLLFPKAKHIFCFSSPTSPTPALRKSAFPAGIPNPTQQMPCNKAAAGDLWRYCPAWGRIWSALQRSGSLTLRGSGPFSAPAGCGCSPGAAGSGWSRSRSPPSPASLSTSRCCISATQEGSCHHQLPNALPLLSTVLSSTLDNDPDSHGCVWPEHRGHFPSSCPLLI